MDPLGPRRMIATKQKDCTEILDNYFSTCILIQMLLFTMFCLLKSSIHLSPFQLPFNYIVCIRLTSINTSYYYYGLLLFIFIRKKSFTDS